MPRPPLLSPYLQDRRFRAVQPYLCGDILDLGCGRAELAAWLAPGQSYVGVEGDLPRVTELSSRFPAFQFLRRDLDQDDLEIDQQFDTVTLIAVVEHLVNPGYLLRQIPGLLKPGGRLVLTTPSPLGDRIHRLGARLGIFSMIAVHDHAAIYSPATLRSLLENAGLRLVHYHSFLFGGNQLFLCEQAMVPGSGM